MKPICAENDKTLKGLATALCMETTLMLENSYKQVQFLDGITQRLTQSEIWLSVYLMGCTSYELLALQKTFALPWDRL